MRDIAEIREEMGTTRPVGARANELREGTGSDEMRDHGIAGGEVTEQNGRLREKLAIINEEQEGLRQQPAGSNRVQQRENEARTEEIAGLWRQQETFAKPVGNLNQQFAQLTGARSSTEEKFDDLKQPVGAGARGRDRYAPHGEVRRQGPR
jgi:hypothetical protein